MIFSVFCSDRPSVQECLNHPWLNTEELFQRSPIRKSRRSCGSEQKQRRKKLKKMQKQNGVADGEWFNFCLYVVMHLLCSLTVCLACLINSLAVTFKGQFIKIAPRHILPVLSTQLIAPSRMQGATPCREEFLCNALFFLLYVNASAVQCSSELWTRNCANYQKSAALCHKILLYVCARRGCWFII